MTILRSVPAVRFARIIFSDFIEKIWMFWEKVISLQSRSEIGVAFAL